MVDLFCGCGGMTIGLAEAARRMGLALDVRLAIDSDDKIAAVYRSNLGGHVLSADVAAAFPGTVGQPLDAGERATKAEVGRLEMLLGGPPCQGHSDLNNHTRRSDPKNALYLRMARAAEVLGPAVVVIENVPPVQWDSDSVVDSTRGALESLGYTIGSRVLDCSLVGVPQTRRRFILIASRVSAIQPMEILDGLAQTKGSRRTVRWAIEDLVSSQDGSELDRASRQSEANRRRIAYLQEKGVVDLPNSERPKCHRDSPNHSYKSMYGRLAWEDPAQTITTGFTSMGQGRFVHPYELRTLTPHEAARLQTFPDWFSWGDQTPRTCLSTMIGNAVPPLVMLALGMPILRGLQSQDG